MAARLYYMDNLRAGAMLLGVFFHASLAYAQPLNEFWFINDHNDSAILTVFAWASHAFRMPIFFLIAGYFGHLLTEKRGLKAYLSNRFFRIAVPFIIFLPLLAGASFGVINFALRHVDEPSRMLLFIQERLNNPSGGVGDAGTLHLWFLYYLMFLSLIAAGLTRFRSVWFEKILSAFLASSWMLILAPVLLIPALYIAGAPTPSPDRLAVKLWPFGYFGLFFAFGWRLYGAEDIIKRAGKAWPLLLVIAAWCFLVYHLLLPALAYPAEPIELWRLVTLSVLQAYISVFATVAALSLGMRWLDNESGAVRYIADASYWLYIVHLPMVVMAQALLANLELNVWLKFLLASAGPILIGLGAYTLFVRHTPIGALLNGVRPRFPHQSELIKT